MFEIRLDKPQRFAHIVVHGFWNDEWMTRYESDVRRTYLELKQLGGTTKLLVDHRGCPVQAAKYVERAKRMIARLQHLRPERVAILVSDTLVKMQMTRALAPGRDTRVIFTSEDEAMAWLFGEETDSLDRCA
jgi:hypothetical protein